MYQSPIEIITRQMRTQFEDKVFKTIQDYGIVVDKEELIKALQYDREQYEKGFADGMLAPKQSEWISVEERLPEENGYYLVYTKYGYVEYERYKMWDDDDLDGGYWWELEGRVTHWMPLPEPPKKGGGE